MILRIRSPTIRVWCPRAPSVYSPTITEHRGHTRSHSDLPRWVSIVIVRKCVESSEDDDKDGDECRRRGARESG